MLNEIRLIGNLGQDPEVRFTPQGTACCKFSLATNEKWTDKNGQKQEKVEWHRVVCWSKLAETCGQYLGKGKQVYVEGKMQYREYEKDGQRHWAAEITARRVLFLGGAGGGGRRDEDAPDPTPPDEGAQPAPIDDDDIPF